MKFHHLAGYLDNLQLVGGFNPFQKYWSIGSFRQVGVKIKNVGNHSLANQVPINQRFCLALLSIASQVTFSSREKPVKPVTDAWNLEGRGCRGS